MAGPPNQTPTPVFVPCPFGSSGLADLKSGPGRLQVPPAAGVKISLLYSSRVSERPNRPEPRRH
jgi:hypothetical protein